MALSDPRKNERVSIQNCKTAMFRRCAGFTLVEIMIVVAIIGLLAAIALPNFMKSRETSLQNTCINNLRRIQYGKEQWAINNGMSTGDVPVHSEINLHIKGGTAECPSTGAYSYNNVGTDATCSIGGHTLPN